MKKEEQYHLGKTEKVYVAGKHENQKSNKNVGGF